MTVNWVSIGQVQVSDVPQLFPQSVLSDTFRITTTIIDIPGWETERIRSGAYIKFIYPDAVLTQSPRIYIPVVDTPTIYHLPVPDTLRNQGYFLRHISCILSSRWTGKLPYSTGFAKWTMKIEEFQI